VLGGTQSLHTNGMDEAFAIPTEEAMKIALRTQQIIADESGAAQVVDPLGGSYFVENLTTQYEREIFKVIDYVDQNGGTIKLTEDGWFQRRIADFAYETALKKANGEKPVIGVNKFVDPNETFDEIELHPYDSSTATRQIERLNRVRRERNKAKFEQLLNKLVEAAKDEKQNIMPITIELVAAGATMGDIIEKLKTIWGTYREKPVF
jgi:methylmalonyl-CoA mutase cobalamin-binding domain/chain